MQLPVVNEEQPVMLKLEEDVDSSSVVLLPSVMAKGYCTSTLSVWLLYSWIDEVVTVADAAVRVNVPLCVSLAKPVFVKVL